MTGEHGRNRQNLGTDLRCVRGRAGSRGGGGRRSIGCVGENRQGAPSPARDVRPDARRRAGGRLLTAALAERGSRRRLGGVGRPRGRLGGGGPGRGAVHVGLPPARRRSSWPGPARWSRGPRCSTAPSCSRGTPTRPTWSGSATTCPCVPTALLEDRTPGGRAAEAVAPVGGRRDQAPASGPAGSASWWSATRPTTAASLAAVAMGRAAAGGVGAHRGRDVGLRVRRHARSRRWTSGPAGDEVRVHEAYGGRSVRRPARPRAGRAGRGGGGRGRPPRHRPRLRPGRRDAAGTDAWVVSELELIEPGLYLDVDPRNGRAVRRPGAHLAELIA